MAHIELRLFRYFVTLCDEMHFSRAAERLDIAPPTLTHQIQKLENELGVRLLTRKSKSKVQITDAGARFLESARDVLHRADEAEISARKVARGEVGRLEIGYMVATAYAGLAQRFVGGFQKLYPAIDITLRQFSTVDLADAILANEMDGGFARLLKQYPSGLSAFPLHRARIVLALPSTHPLARKRGAVSPQSLVDEAFVSTSIGYDLALMQHIKSIAALGKFTPKVSKRAEDLTTVLAYVAAGYGIAAISEDMASCRIPNVTFKPIATGAMLDVVYSFMYRTNEAAPACKAFIEVMRGHAQKGLTTKR